MANTLRQRLLRDIAEIQTKPYPNIALHPHDHDLNNACLILTVEGYGSMHLTVEFPQDYPLSPPKIGMNSNIKHPNVYGSYICSSILNTTEGYTSAYTLKGIAIQLLSFFSSDKIEQQGGRHFISLDTYKSNQKHVHDAYKCLECQFGLSSFTTEALKTSGSMIADPEDAALTRASRLETLPGITLLSTAREQQEGTKCRLATVVSPTRELKPTTQMSSHAISQASMSARSLSTIDRTPAGQGPILGRTARRRKGKQNREARARSAELATFTPAESSLLSVVPMDVDHKEPAMSRNIVDMKLPSEVILLICNQLDTEDLLLFAGAWGRIPHIMSTFDILRTRELQCFCLKQDWLTLKLGIGVHVDGRSKSLESEFDLLSETGFYTHRIRRSTQGRPFEYWLPLPISNGHWRKVAGDVPRVMARLAASANIPNPSPFSVLCAFMNGIVVKLNQASESQSATPRYPYSRRESIASSLNHASEKAIESYFHLFHLLLCLAIESPTIVTSANATISSFVSGRVTKTDCPSLGHLLVAALISEVDVTETVIKLIIKEAVTRNVVWMLKGNPELAYLEPSAVSEYRLHHTFQASKTSYRLLMFLDLFRKTAVGNPRKPLIQLRDEAFERHGAPPRGSAKGLADAIKQIHAVNRFPDFFSKMGITDLPTKEQFNRYLQDRIQDSADKGYSCMAVSQGEAFTLRQAKEPDVAVKQGLVVSFCDEGVVNGRSFFPDTRASQAGNHRGRGGRSGRRGRGG
ncbi:Ubiquitin-ligase [Hyphodiscus hymeniophilus]|uniref:Ubiquitin-ligase n=1 Tax=Hyphodiscus hymeniophilus TaxID=353542 RepID=A0A9P7B0U4_9HELO|nr:Ubiquitin-ligase [Hyphodiscus hymeniophilus]